MRPENKRMTAFLKTNGIEARPKWLRAGSLKQTWRLHNSETPWTLDLAAKLNSLGFTDYDGRPLGQFSGNGGYFSVFVRGHEELLTATP